MVLTLHSIEIETKAVVSLLQGSGLYPTSYVVIFKILWHVLPIQEAIFGMIP